MMGYIESVVGIISALIGICNVIYKFSISKMHEKKPLERLIESLEKGNSIVLKEELKYQIKCYVPQKFVNDGNVLSLKGVEKKIWKLSGNLYAITGKPASGKTIAIRKLYCEMAKRKKRIKCIFFNMNRITEDKDLGVYLSDLIKINNLKKNDEVIAFFDGVDEAISFIGNEKFYSLFLQGVDSEIFNLFRENELDLRGIVLGLRTEFIEGAEKGLREVGNTGDKKYYTKSGNYYMEVFRLEKMSKKDVVKVYKSLKILKALDKKLPKDKRRHQNKYPEYKDRRRYIKFFKKILDDKQSVFYYPMYVRYAYIYMKEYEKEWNPYRGDMLMLSSNMVSAIEMLIEVIIKWEFHIYNAVQNKTDQLEQNKTDQLEQREFSINMHKCLYDIIEKMAENDMQKISREQLKVILENHSLNVADAIEKIMPVFAHCLMISDYDGKAFEFFHFTFYEYFLAKYLIYEANAGQRGKYLALDSISENFLHIYYEILYMDKKLNEKTLGNTYDFGLKDFIDKKSIVKIIDKPNVPMLEIHDYLPFINEYIYRGITYTQRQLEDIRESGILDISDTEWDRVEYAKGIVYPEYVSYFNLYGLPLKNIDALKEYKNLKQLDIRISKESTISEEDILDAIQNCFLQCIYINTNDGIVCEKLNDMAVKNELYIEKVYADTPDYSEAHIRIYQLKQGGPKIQFHICTRSDWSYAKLEYKKSNKKKNPDLLKAVFELEADEDGILGLKGEGIEPTLWNGLSLAEYYLYQDKGDEDKRAFNICSRLEPYILMDDSRLSVYFGRTFGKTLGQAEKHSKAKRWFENTWKHGRKFFLESMQYEKSEKGKSKVISLGLYLYKEYICCKDDKEEEFAKELLELIKESGSYQESTYYLSYLRLSIAYIFNNWKEGEEAPKGLRQEIWNFRRIAEAYANKNNAYGDFFHALYFSILYANRIEDLERSAQLLENLQNIIQKENLDETNRDQQGRKIQYWEQKIYYLFLKGDNNEIIEVIDELVDYPYRTYEKSLDSYSYIREVSLQKLEKDVDKHRLWQCIWY